MLLGRQAISGHMQVDTSDSFVTKESYEGLEDADEFRSEDDQPYVVWIGGGRWGQHTTYGYYNNINAAMAAAEVLSGPVSISVGEDGEEVWNNGVRWYSIPESYEGLEDADEFDADDDEVEVLNVMGFTPDSLGIPPELQENGLELSDGNSALWDASEERWYHEHDPHWTLNESEYWGLEDEDEFDDGSDQQEIEEVDLWFHANDVRVVENGGIVDIVDSHGVLEGLPDGRRFGDDIPIDRIVTDTNPHMTHLPHGHEARTYPQEWLVLHINDTYVLAWEIGKDDGWQTLTTEQVEEMNGM